MKFLILISALLIANVYCVNYRNSYESNSYDRSSPESDSYESIRHRQDKPVYSIIDYDSYSSSSSESNSYERPNKMKKYQYKLNEPVVYSSHESKSYEIKESYEREPKRFNNKMRDNYRIRTSDEIKDYIKPVYPVKQNVYANNDYKIIPENKEHKQYNNRPMYGQPSLYNIIKDKYRVQY